MTKKKAKSPEAKKLQILSVTGTLQPFKQIVAGKGDQALVRYRTVVWVATEAIEDGTAAAFHRLFHGDPVAVAISSHVPDVPLLRSSCSMKAGLSMKSTKNADYYTFPIVISEKELQGNLVGFAAACAKKGANLKLSLEQLEL